MPGDLNELSCVENHLYLYGEIEYSKILELNSYLYLLSIADDISDIYIHICSDGGDLEVAFATADTINILKQIKPIYTIIEGRCFSAATIISIMGTRRYITPNSFILIHELSTEISGNASHIKQESTNNALLMNKMKVLYKQHTKIPVRKLSKLFQTNLYLDAKKALDYNIVDEEASHLIFIDPTKDE